MTREDEIQERARSEMEPMITNLISLYPDMPKFWIEHLCCEALQAVIKNIEKVVV